MAQVDAAERGLSADEVETRVREGRVNSADVRTSRTLGEIVRANVFTRFNALLGTMFVLILIFGAGQDALFGFVLLFNTLIGVIQEWRAKRTLDRLAVLSAPRAHVVRDGTAADIPVEGIVVDDVLELRTGDQVPADGTVLSSDGLEVDESLLTGESDPVLHHPGDDVRSGSIVVAGNARMRATAVGADAYAHKLAVEARRFALVRSELMDGINTILRYVQWALIPTAALLALSQFQTPHSSTREAIAGVVAGVVAMIPEGLVLLTSVAFAVAAVALARKSVLVQELPAVEGLARIDVVLLDKTGTLTEGAIQFEQVHPLEEGDHAIDDALGALADDEHGNATLVALGHAFPPPQGWERTESTPFSSARKWSSATFRDQGTWILGAPENVLHDRSADDPVRTQANELAALGQRVVLLARSEAETLNDKLPPDVQAAALVVFEEQIRSDAADTLAYFARQGVRSVVISGDNPRTVGAVAARVGIDGADHPMDAREVGDDDWSETLKRASVFGRVTPQQKRAIVHALQGDGHVVAMTGDGVNDALALKDADIGVAMGNGAPATRAVAQIVLLNSEFATMPSIVGEGRRVIANIERVANLFVTKTFYAMLLAILIGIARWPYPFLPRHLTIISSLTIGIPAFFLALGPNERRYVPGFIKRVARFAGPCGLVAGTATFVSYAIAFNASNVTVDEARTAATLTLGAIGLWILGMLARPITPLRGLLVGAMIGAFAILLAVPGLRDFFALSIPRGNIALEASLCALVGIIVLETGWQVAQWRLPKGARTARFARRPPVSS